jgi:hypothetical protein
MPEGGEEISQNQLKSHMPEGGEQISQNQPKSLNYLAFKYCGLERT